MKTLLHYLLKETFVIFSTIKSTTTLLFSFAPSGSNNAFENQVTIKPLSSNQIRKMFLFAVFLFAASGAFGQIITTSTTWSALNPGSTANITINSGGSLTIDVPSATCASITINNATNSATSSLTIASTNELILSGALTMNEPTGTSANSTVAVGNGSLQAASFSMASNSSTKFSQLTLTNGSVTVNGSFTESGTGPANNKVLISGTGSINIKGNLSAVSSTITAGTGTFNFNGSGSQTVSGTNTFNNLTISNTTAPVTFSAGNTINGLLTVNSSASLIASGALTLGAVTVNALGTLTLNAASAQIGILTLNGTLNGSNILTLNGTANVLGSGIFSNSQVTMGGNRVFDASSSLTLATVLINSAITITNNGNTTITTSLEGNHASTSVWINAANSTLNAGGILMASKGLLTTSANPNTVNYNGTAQTVYATTYNNLTLSGSGTKTIGTGITIGSVLSIAPTGSAKATIGISNINVPQLFLGGFGKNSGVWNSTNASGFINTGGTITVSIDSRTTPSITTSPTASAITYGQNLVSSVLSGGVASVAGTFAFTTPATALNAGTSSQDVTFTPSDTANYKSATTLVNVTVNKASLTIIGLTGVSRAYNGLTTATSSGTAAYVGLQTGDTFSVTGTPVLNFADALVGTGKAITVTGYSAPSSNYILTQPTGLSANITAAALTITG